MNDSPFGLTAAIWTRDQAAALTLGEQVQTGTWFMNRCDYLDPALAWVGRQGLRTRLHALGGGLRASDAAKIISSAGDDVSCDTQSELELSDHRLGRPRPHRRAAGGVRSAGHPAAAAGDRRGTARSADGAAGARAGARDRPVRAGARQSGRGQYRSRPGCLPRRRSRRRDRVRRRLGTGCRQGDRIHVGADAPAMGLRGRR